MEPRETTDATFNSDLPADGLAVIDFWATWCGPCRAFAPVFAESAAKNPDVVHLKVDVDHNPELSQAFEIRSIPTTVFVKGNEVLGSVPGAMSAARFAELLDQARQTG